MIGGRLEARTSGGTLHRRNANDSDMIPAKPSGSKRDTGRFIKNPKVERDTQCSGPRSWIGPDHPKRKLVGHYAG